MTTLFDLKQLMGATMLFRIYNKFILSSQKTLK